MTKITMTDLLTPGRVISRLRLRSKSSVLHKLATCISRDTGLLERMVTKTVMSCADLPVFGPSRGVALPHTFIPDIDKPIAAFARLSAPVNFGAADGHLTDLVALLLSPNNSIGAHLPALACIARRLRNREVRERLRAADSRDSIYVILVSDEWSHDTISRTCAAS